MLHVALRIAPLFWLTACAASLGPVAGTEVAGTDSVILGARASGVLTLGRDSGFGVGLTHEEAWTLAESPSFAPDRWHTAISAGYLQVPLPHRNRIGYEGHLLGGMGRLEMRGRLLPALTAGARLALPIRLTTTRELWDDEAPVAATPMLVPEFQTVAWFPHYGDAFQDVAVELSAGLSIRLAFWSSLLP